MFRRSKFLALTCILTISAVLMLAVVISLCLSGTLGAEKPTLVFRSNSAKMVYNGSSLSDNGYSLLSGELKEGHRAKVNVTGLQEGVGKSENRLYVTILDEIGADVTEDYDVVIEYGILEIKPIEIAIRTEGGVKEYDGTPLVNGEWSVTTRESLMSGDRVEVKITGTQTEIGTSFNTFVARFYNALGQDVSYNYDVKSECGLLVISKINLTVQSYSETVPYGQVAECHEYGFNDWSLLPGHTVADVMISGRQEVPGSSPNTIDYVRIVDEMTGEDVSEYYNIIKNEGILKVESNSLSDDETLAYVTSSLGGRIYLKQQSFGDYLGNSWAEASEYPYSFDESFSADYLTGTAIKNSSVSHYVNSVKVTWLNGGFGLPYYMSMGVRNPYDQKSDVLYTSSLSEYTVNSYILPEGVVYLHSEQNMGLSDYEIDYRNYVYNNYTHIPSTDTREYMENIIAENGFYSKDLATIYKVARFIQNSAIYDLKYDTALDSESDVAVAFLSQYKKGVCRHYAASATMLYRAMGIPARYTEGYAVPTASGLRASVNASMRHAWVEVYIDGMGWMMIEVTGSAGTSYGGETVKITVNNMSVKYGDTIPQITYKGFEAYAAEGYRFEPVFSDIPYEYGKHSVQIVDYRIYDPDGMDITDLMAISQKPGTVQIYRATIDVNNFGKGGMTLYEYVYDGNEHRITNLNCTTAGFESMGLKLVMANTGSYVSVYEGPAIYDVQILDAKGNDVTDEYKIVKSYARIKITPRPIEITIDDVKASFSGNTITASSYKLTGGSLVKGHTITDIVFEGSQTEIGCSDSSISSITIKDGGGASVVKNYSISYIPGELRITS